MYLTVRNSVIQGWTFPLLSPDSTQLQRRSEGRGPCSRDLSWRCKVKINISAHGRAFRRVQMQQVRNSLYSIILRCVNAFGFAITHLTPVLCALPTTSIYKQRSWTDGCYTASSNISDLFPVPWILFEYILLCQYNGDGMPLQVKSKAPLFKAAEKWGKANEQDVLDAVSGTPVLQQELNGCRYKVSQVWISQGSPTTPQHAAQPWQVMHRNRHWVVLLWGIKSTLIKPFALHILDQYLEKSGKWRRPACFSSKVTHINLDIITYIL